MQDEEINEVVEEVVADESQATEEVDQQEQVEAEEVEDESEETVVEQPSRRETLRIQSLLAKYGPPTERQQPAPYQREDALDYQTALDADPETIRQLEADRRAEGQSQYNEGLKRAEFLDWKTSLRIDAPNVEKKYPVLDKNSPDFHPAVADSVNNWYLQMSGFDPRNSSVNNSSVSYADFVEGFMELVQETAGQKTAQTVKNIAKQAATTGLRPDGSSAKRMNLNKVPQDMSMEELYASIGQTYKK